MYLYIYIYIICSVPTGLCTPWLLPWNHTINPIVNPMNIPRLIPLTVVESSTAMAAPPDPEAISQGCATCPSSSWFSLPPSPQANPTQVVLVAAWMLYVFFALSWHFMVFWGVIIIIWWISFRIWIEITKLCVEATAVQHISVGSRHNSCQQLWLWSENSREHSDHPILTWLVVWLPFFIFPYIGFLIIPLDFHIFQRGGPTTNQ